MFNHHFSAILTVSATLALLASSCQGTALNNESSGESRSTNADSIISEFELRESIKTASENYRIESDDSIIGTIYLTVSASVQWPEELGKYKIDNLRDTIINYTFDSKANRDINKAITNDVTDVAQFQLGGTPQKITSVPDSMSMFAYYSNRSLQLVECTEQTVTYSATFSEYLGGAHPFSKSTPFTFILETDKMVNVDYLFTTGYESKLLPILMDAIAGSHSMSTDDLKAALLSNPEINSSSMVYLLNGSIVFHFNPYDILPYSFGPTDAYVSPYEVSEILKPEAKKLLLDM